MDTTFIKNKKILLICGAFAILFLLLLALLLLQGKQNRLFFPIIPTPTPVGGFVSSPSINTKAQISVTATDPENGATNVDISKTIRVTFNRNIDKNEVSFVVNPPFTFTSEVTENTLTIHPTEKLSQYTAYSFFISFLSFLPSPTFTFTTVSPNPSVTPFQGDTVREHSDQNNKIILPDLFLSNYCPYQSDDFSVEAVDTPYPEDHFFFNVTLNRSNPNAKQLFINWLHSLTLSDEQIATLDIRYL